MKLRCPAKVPRGKEVELCLANWNIDRSYERTVCWHNGADAAECTNSILETRDDGALRDALLLLQQITQTTGVGPLLVPYYRQILPILNLFKSKRRNLGDEIDFRQQRSQDLGRVNMSVCYLYCQATPDAVDVFVELPGSSKLRRRQETINAAGDYILAAIHGRERQRMKTIATLIEKSKTERESLTACHCSKVVRGLEKVVRAADIHVDLKSVIIVRDSSGNVPWLPRSDASPQVGGSV